MAHVICEYATYYCTRTITDHYFATECEEQLRSCADCGCLEVKPCFLEKTSKNVHFDDDGFLKVGEKIIAWVDDSPEFSARDGSSIIEYLMINGNVYVENGQ